MTVLIGSWEFEGPFTDIKELRPEPGLAAILVGLNNEYELMAMEESDCVQDFLRHKGKYNPEHLGGKSLALAIYYCSDLTSSLRQGLIEEVMKEFDDEEECFNQFDLAATAV